MVHLSAKELRFSNMAVVAELDARHRAAWTDWYDKGVEKGELTTGFHTIPVHLTSLVINAVSGTKSRLKKEIEASDNEVDDLVNDFSIYSCIAEELQHSS